MSDIGINFRATSTFVTDGAGETYDLAAAYPVTRGSYTFGWVGGASAGPRDRNSSVDRRLAGVQTWVDGRYWRIDLPAGTYDVYAAFGDYSFAQRVGWLLTDGAGPTLATYSTGGTQISPQTWLDGSGTVRTLAQWPSNNAPVQVTLTADHFRLVCNIGGALQSAIAHLRFASVSSGSTYNETGSGGSLAGGSAVANKTSTATTSGGSVVGGSALISRLITVSVSGSSLAGGSALTAARLTVSTSGGAVVSGSAGGTFDQTMAGGSTAAGSALVSLASSFTATSGAILSGSTTPQVVYVETPQGGVAAGSVALVWLVAEHLATGGAILSGLADIAEIAPSVGNITATVSLRPKIAATCSVRPRVTATCSVRPRVTATCRLNAV